MDENSGLSKPDSKLDKVGHLIGLVLGVIGLVLYAQGPNTAWSGGDFYDILALPFFYIIPIWMLVMSIYYLSFWGTANKIFGLITGLVGLAATGLGFLTALQFFPERLPFTGSMDTFLISWYMSSLVIGVAVLLFGLISIKVYLPNRSANPFGTYMGLLFLAFGFFMILIGIVTGFSAIPLPLDYTLIPLSYNILIVSSILGFIK